jgi:hypothetical protein
MRIKSVSLAVEVFHKDYYDDNGYLDDDNCYEILDSSDVAFI